MNYNAVISVEDISDDSGVITEPVSLDEMKNYLRTEGFQDASQIVPEPTIQITLPEGETNVQDDRLIDAVILSLAREGTIYSQALVVGNRKFTYATDGTLTFLTAGNPGGETLDISYGYQNDSGVFNFTGDDDLLTEIITAARQLIEETAGISIVNHTWEAYLTNLCGRIEIPYGPVVEIISLKDSSGNTISSDNYKTVGNLWKYLVYPCQKDMVMEFRGHWIDLPKMIKIHIMRLVAYLYINRGDDSKVKEFTYQLCFSYSRNTVIA